MSQESNKEPVGLEVGRILVAAVYIEKGSDPDCASKLAPRYQALFLRASHARRASSADCRLVVLSVCSRTLPCGYLPAAGRWRSHRTREAGRKKTEVRGGEFIRTFESSAFFRIACAKHSRTQRLVFGWVLGRGLKAASLTFPLLPQKRRLPTGSLRKIKK